MFNNQYEEHLASQPDNSRWDGFDRGDKGGTGPDMGKRCIGRMTNEADQRVEIFEEWYEEDSSFTVWVDGHCVFADPGSTRERAITVGRWWMSGCPS